MTAVRWSAFEGNPAGVESLVKRLIVRLDARAIAIDGAGGDGGIDVLIESAEGPVIYEVKSFLRRLTNSQKRQIKRSLEAAAAHSPVSWHLIVPIDPTPAEHQWFETLRGAHTFVGRWLGRTWLDEHLARYPDIVRSTWPVEREILEAVTEHHAEQAMLTGGAPDVISRLRRLNERADELSADWRLSAQIGPDGAEVIAVEPKHDNSQTDAPITFTVSLQDAESIAGGLPAEIATALKYGRSVTVPGSAVDNVRIDAPAELGLAGTWPGKAVDQLAISTTPQPEDIDGTVAAVDPNGRVIRSIGIHFTERYQGQGGQQIVGHDNSRMLTATVTVAEDNVGIVNFRLAVQPPDHLTPDFVLPVLEILTALKPGNAMRFTTHFETHPPVSADMAVTGDEGFGDLEPWRAAVNDLHFIQHAVGDSFPVPNRMTIEDAEHLHVVRRLIEGERVPWRYGPITMTIRAELAADFARNDETHAVMLAVPWVDDVLCGRAVRLGPVHLHVAAARLVNAEWLLSVRPDDPDPVGEFEVQGDGIVYAKLAGDPSSLDPTSVPLPTTTEPFD